MQGQADRQALIAPVPVSRHLPLHDLAGERGGIAITWQVYEGAPGRRAAVRDGEGHSVDLRGQVGDI